MDPFRRVVVPLLLGLLSGCITVKAPSVTEELRARREAKLQQQAEAPLVPSLRFRTNEPKTASERATSALRERCGELDPAASSAGTLATVWQRTDYRSDLHRYFLRCSVSLVPNPEDDSADVNVTFELARCPRLKLADEGVVRAGITADQVEQQCAKAPRAQSLAMAEDLAGRAQGMQQTIFRR